MYRESLWHILYFIRRISTMGRRECKCSNSFNEEPAFLSSSTDNSIPSYLAISLRLGLVCSAIVTAFKH